LFVGLWKSCLVWRLLDFSLLIWVLPNTKGANFWLKFVDWTIP
jgi:hypothetical protein